MAFRPRLLAGLAFSMLSTNRSSSGHFVQSIILIRHLFGQSAMAVLGQQQTFSLILPEGPLLRYSGHDLRQVSRI